MSALEPAAAPTRTARTPGRMLQVTGLAVLTALGLAVIAGGGAGAAVWHAQQNDLAAARADRASAERTLDGALAHAAAGGVTAARLASVVEQERRVESEAAVPARLRVFDGGETGHVRSEASRLRTLVGEVDAIEAGATTAERTTVADLLTRYDTAIATASAGGVDMSGDQAYDDLVHGLVTAAASPNAVNAAVAQVEARITDVTTRLLAKRAADAAAAAFAASHDAAQAALASADSLLAQAQPFPQLQVAGWTQTVAAQHQAFSVATTQAAFDAVTAATTPAVNGLRALLGARSGAYQDMAQARQIVQDALSVKVDPGSVPAQLDALQPPLDAAGTTDAFTAVTAQIDAVKNPLEDKVVMATLGVGKVIFISLANQHLTAYQDGATIVSTPVTTGRPALPTPTGNYAVVRKNHPWMMHSDFPPSSPYWYPDTWVQYVLWFRNDGYGIHDAPWRSTYGPGTEASGSHGCVNVPYNAEVTLYNWADVGTRVIIR